MKSFVVFLLIIFANSQIGISQTKKELIESIDSLKSKLESESLNASRQIHDLRQRINTIQAEHFRTIETKNATISELKSTIDSLNHKITVLLTETRIARSNKHLSADMMFHENTTTDSFIKLIEDIIIDDWLLVDEHSYLHEWIYKYKSTNNSLEKIVLLNGDGGSTITEEIVIDNGEVRLFICYGTSCQSDHGEDSNNYGITYFRDNKAVFVFNEERKGECTTTTLPWKNSSTSCTQTFEEVTEKYEYGIEFLNNKQSEE